MKTRKINPASILAIGAAALSGFAPGTAPVADQSAPTVRTSQPRSERAAQPVQTQARAAFGISMLGRGGHYSYGHATSPWDAPIYNQRKARRDARRTNRKVTR